MDVVSRALGDLGQRFRAQPDRRPAPIILFALNRRSISLDTMLVRGLTSWLLSDRVMAGQGNRQFGELSLTSRMGHVLRKDWLGGMWQRK